MTNEIPLRGDDIDVYFCMRCKMCVKSPSDLLLNRIINSKRYLGYVEIVDNLHNSNNNAIKAPLA